MEDAVQNEGQAYSKGLELTGSAPTNETPGVVSRWVECIAWELVGCSSCPSLSFRYHVRLFVDFGVE